MFVLYITSKRNGAALLNIQGIHLKFKREYLNKQKSSMESRYDRIKQKIFHFTKEVIKKSIDDLCYFMYGFIHGRF